MRTPNRIRICSLLASAGLLALSAGAFATPMAAQGPTCDGLPATITDNDGTDADPDVGTIVGTNGPDVIVGTDDTDVIEGLGGKDVICGREGADSIDGGGGNDRLFGGGDDDFLIGGPGSDDLFGFAGNDLLNGATVEGTEGANNRDFLKGGAGEDDLYGGPGDDILQGNGASDHLRGQAGDDKLNGGAQADNCKQGAGSGPVWNCERADLRVWIVGPASPAALDFSFKVKVRNLGPDPSGYVLVVDEDNHSVQCDQPWEAQAQSFGKLNPDSTRTRTYAVDCVIEGDNPWIEISAQVTADARDPHSGNNEDESPRIDLE